MTVQFLAFVDLRGTPCQSLLGGAGVHVLGRFIDKNIVIEAPIKLGSEGLRLRHLGLDASLVTRQDFIAFEITLVGHH